MTCFIKVFFFFFQNTHTHKLFRQIPLNDDGYPGGGLVGAKFGAPVSFFGIPEYITWPESPPLFWMRRLFAAMMDLQSFQSHVNTFRPIS